MSKELYNYMKPWLCAPTDNVLKAFSEIPGAIDRGTGLARYVYIPGTRKDRVLLVAHSDTVWKRGDEKIIPALTEDETTIVSAKYDIGIGADDRAGCAMLWRLKDLGHSLLIPNGEECGGIGSDFLMSDPEMAKEIQEHQFAIEFDRMNDKDLVFYSVGTVSFKNFLEENLLGFKQSIGSYTDICTLCKDICGVNISIGYYNQHSNREILILQEWYETYLKVKELLTMEEIPKFPLRGAKVNRVSKLRYRSSDFKIFRKPKPKNEVSTFTSTKTIPLLESPKESIDYSEYEEVESEDQIAIEDMIAEIYVCSDCFGACMTYEAQLTGKCPFCQVLCNA